METTQLKQLISLYPDSFTLDRKKLNTFLKSQHPTKVYKQISWWIDYETSNDDLIHTIDVRDFYKIKKNNSLLAGKYVITLE